MSSYSASRAEEEAKRRARIERIFRDRIAPSFSTRAFTGCVYLMYAELTRQYKIGISSKTATWRRKGVESAAGVPVKLVEFWDVSDNLRATEQHVHAKLHDYRTVGEWFRFPDEMTEEDVRSLVERTINGFD
jgi:hypothetical protein